MTDTRRTPSARTASAGTGTGTAQLPTTVWLPDRHVTQLAATAPAVLPTWAIDKIRREFADPGQSPAPLLRIQVRDTESGMDARVRARTHSGTETDTGTSTRTCAGGTRRPPLLLAELHPDALPSPGANLAGSDMPGALDDGWPGFFHRAHRYLRGSGLLLLATRQRRDGGRLTDPLGLLIASARTAGFIYLQHIVIVHGHAVADRIVPAPPDDTSPDLVHSDLIALAARP